MRRTTIVLLILLATTADARRRAVSPGPETPITTAPNLVLPTTPTSIITITNHGPTADVLLCALNPTRPGTATTCTTITMSAGTSVQRSATSMNVTQPTITYLSIRSGDGNIEARADGSLAMNTGPLSGTGVSAYTFGPADITTDPIPTLTVYTTTTPVTGRIILHERFGTIIEVKPFALPAYALLQGPLYEASGLFTSKPQNDMTIEVHLDTGVAGSYARTNNSVTTMTHTMSDQLLYYLPRVHGNTTVRLYNKAPQNNVAFIEYLAGNATADVYKHLVIQEVATLPKILTTTLRLPPSATGALRITSPITLPFSAMSSSTTGLQSSDAAISKSASFSNQNDPIRDASINGLTTDDELDILNVSKDPLRSTLISITGTLTIHDENGTIIATRKIALNPYNSVRYKVIDLVGKPVMNARAYLHLDNDSDTGQVVPPTALLTASTSTGISSAFTIVAPPPKVTGEQYVQRYLDILHVQYYYLDNRTIRCMINGNCGVASIRSQLAAIYARGIGETWTVDTFATWLATMSNGITNASDIELWEKNDPYGWNATGVISHVLTTSQDVWTKEPGNIRQTPADTELLWQVNRAFLIQLIEAHPEWYGGTAASGPSITFDPTWTTSDPNDASGATDAYQTTVTIKVVDHGQGFMQTTHPRSAILTALLNVSTLDVYADGGKRAYTCENNPDAIVNTLGELIANYRKLTPAEQQEFSGDRDGLAPFVNDTDGDGSPCNTAETDQQYVNIIEITITHQNTSTVTGEQYIAKWLDILKEQYFYLNNAEARCMINGNCGTRTYVPDMAGVLGPGTGNDASTIETLLRQWVDGTYVSGNQELFAGFDPVNTSMVNNGVGFYFMPDGSRLSRFIMPETSMQPWYAVVRSFLVDYTQTHPEQYGGTTATGPNLNFDPTWTTQDANDAAGTTPPSYAAAEQYVAKWLDPLQNSRAYLNATETRCLLQGTCGTSSYALDLARPLQEPYVSSWATPQILAEVLRTWADGNDTNGEIFGSDPLGYVNTGSPTNLHFLMQPSGGAIPFNLNAAQMPRALAAVRAFLIEYVAAHPEAYGGNSTSGPNTNFDPTWRSRDPN